MCASVRRGRKVVLDRRAHRVGRRDVAGDIAATAHISLPVMGGHVRHEHALDFVGGHGVGRGRHVHVRREDIGGRGGISSPPVRGGELEICDRVRALGKRRRPAIGSLRNKKPDLSGRPPCKDVAIGTARRGARRSGEHTRPKRNAVWLPAGGGSDKVARGASTSSARVFG